MRDLIFGYTVKFGALIPDINPEMPPGMEGVNTLLNWIAGGVIVLGVGMFLVSAGSLIVGAINGREMNGFKGLAFSILGCVLATAAGVIMAVFL
jgi:hypothetical protein